MSFQDAEASEASLTGTTAILRMALNQPGYVRNPHQVYDNMDSDPYISALPEPGMPVSRVQLLRAVHPHLPIPATIPNHIVLFCRANLQQGPTPPAPRPSTFGRVQSLRSLINAIAGASSGLTLRNAEALVRDAIVAGADTVTKLTRQRSDLAGKNLSRYQMWCYPAADPRNPFTEIGVTREEAVNVLGLGYYAYADPSAELVRWAHALPAPVQTHLPTAWDAGSDKGNAYWRPGGRSYRLDRDEYGVLEILHNSIMGENIAAPIETI